jgi:hypothetical protein
MKISWSKPLRIGKFDSDWQLMPQTPGVYIIRTSRSIKRIGGTDKSGILYVGRASRIRTRIWNFLKANHTASGFLWTHPSIARLVMGGSIRSVADVEEHLSRLTVRYATPMSGRKLALAERALLFSYINQFGEAPPLNLSLTKRWDSMPSSTDLRWAEFGIIERA